MPTYSEIPLSPTPQAFSITLSGVSYWLSIAYAAVDQGGWSLDIADAQKVPVVNGLPLVTGADLLEQYEYLGLPGRLWVQTLSDPDAVPTFDNIGGDAKLLWVTD